MTVQIMCVGHASVDHHFEIDAFAARPTKTHAKSYRMIVGGMGANAAIALQRLGARVTMLGRVGADAPGEFVREQLAAEGVEQQLEVVEGASTSVSSVVVDAQGERQIFTHLGDALVRAHALDTRKLEGAAGVLTDPRWCDGAQAALRWARTHKVLSVLDADVAPREALAQLVPLAQWVVFSENGLQCFAPGASLDEGLRAALGSGAKTAMVTLGDRGVRWTHGQGFEAMPAFAVQALDTTGAGDVFHAALILSLAQGMPEKSAVRYASAAAALKCMRRHGVMGTPRQAEVLDFIREKTQ
jgi:sulfofructose kinase